MKSVIFILVTASALCCRAQQSKTDPTMVKFFAGNWTASGFFTVTMTGRLGRSRL